MRKSSILRTKLLSKLAITEANERCANWKLLITRTFAQSAPTPEKGRLEFEDKVVLVTGSTSGIGEQIAFYFAKYGAKVTVTGRNKKRLDTVCEKCEKVSPLSHKPLGVTADIKNDDDLKKLLDSTVQHFQKLDILVNNVGYFVFKPCDAPDLINSFDDMFKTNLRSSFLLSSLAIPHLVATKGCIVNISSTASVKPEKEMLPTNVFDCAKDMLTRSMALELGPKGIRVNSVRPGYIKTPAYVRDGIDFDKIEALQKQPLKHIGKPEDISHCVLFLASPKSAFITGAHLNADGGMYDV